MKWFCLATPLLLAIIVGAVIGKDAVKGSKGISMGVEGPLKCISPNPAHFIAHSSIDFTVSLEEQDIKNTIERGSLKMCIKLEYIDPAESFKGARKHTTATKHSCGLLEVVVKSYEENEGVAAKTQIAKLDFSIFEMNHIGKVKYTIEYVLKSGMIHTCSSTFNIVHFPGWDNYVQYYYNVTKTVESVKKKVKQNNGVIVPGSPEYPLLSFEKLPDLIGPQIKPPRDDRKLQKSLVATFSGAKSMLETDELIRKFNTPRYKIILFVYDKSEWTSYPWIDDIIFVRITRTMKWWFVKHFLHPEFVQAYEYVLLIDEDCNTKNLNPDLMLDDARKFGVQVGQPANGYGSYGSHNVVRLKGLQDVTNYNVINNSTNVKPEDIPIGTWTNFVECGPFTFFATESWPCVWNLLQPDVTCGYGYDLMWANCAPNRTAVLHHHTMVHENRKPGSGSNKNFGTRCAAEGIFLFERLAHENVSPFDPREIRDFDESVDQVSLKGDTNGIESNDFQNTQAQKENTDATGTHAASDRILSLQQIITKKKEKITVLENEVKELGRELQSLMGEL